MLVGAPLDRLATNILGPFPESTWSSKYFMKLVEIFTIYNQSAVTCKEVILDKVTGCYGCPYNIHLDQGWSYESAIFTEICQLLEILKMRTSPDHPQWNGQVEHFNQTLVSMIKSYLKGRQWEWDRNLGALVGAYNATPHESIGITPNLVMLGRETWLPIEVILGSRHTSTGGQ